MIYTEQSITHTLKVKLKRKKKAHQCNHFSLTIHNYIVSFSVKTRTTNVVRNAGCACSRYTQKFLK